MVVMVLDDVVGDGNNGRSGEQGNGKQGKSEGRKEERKQLLMYVK